MGILGSSVESAVTGLELCPASSIFASSAWEFPTFPSMVSVSTACIILPKLLAELFVIIAVAVEVVGRAVVVVVDVGKVNEEADIVVGEDVEGIFPATP